MESTARETELGILTGLLTECGGGAGRIGMVMGPPGFGKTRLLNAFAGAVADRGLPLAAASCTRADRQVPLGTVRQIAQGLAAPPADLGAPDLAHRLWEALAAGAAGGALVVAVDDAQHADPHSLEVLEHVAHRLRGSRVLLLLAADDAPGSGRPHRVLADLAHHPLCRRVRLAPCSADEVARISVQLLGRPIGPDAARNVHRCSGGSPLLVQSLLEDLDGADEPPAAPRAYTASVAALLPRLGRAPLDAARAAAALGRWSGPGAVAELLGAEVPAAERALDRLGRVGLAERGVLRHPAARAAVREEMDPRERRTLDTRAARLLHRRGAPAADVAEALLSGADTGADWVPGVLREAADHALAAGDPPLAARYLRAVVEGGGEGEDPGAVLALARAEWRSSPAAAAAVALSLPTWDLPLPPADLRWLLELALWHGRTDRAAQARRALERAPAAAGPWVAATHPEQEERPGPPTAAPGAGGGAAAVLARLLGSGSAEGVDGVAPLLRSEGLGGEDAAGVEAALSCLVHAGREAEAAELAAVLHHRADRRGSATWSAVLGALRARIAVRLGDLPEAARLAQACMDAVPPRGLGVFAAVPIAALVEAQTWRGRLEEAERCLYHPLAPTTLRTRYGLSYLAARARFALAAGRPRSALEDFRACGERVRSWGLDTPALVPWRDGAAEALAALGDREGAQTLVEEQRALNAPRTARVRARELVVLAQTREAALRPPLLREAVELLQGGDAALDLCRSLADLGLAMSALGEAERAQAFAEQADRLAHRCGAEPLRRSVAGVLHRPVAEEAHPAGPRCGGGLSPTERRVAALAALGYTNREISRKAHITVSTVEQHLTRAYRKLGVKGRAELSPTLTMPVPGDPSPADPACR
ncbi:helix-turn-helix transcriptional regulator [Nocardiopsis baichengensis]|uniref:helix-turn-helix transcriptional regulator n=1 Tax=Nocardiopsis baichengensis TaxID=280240 RepID=UPI000347464A|nr:LuxR family transcriptional regulator [Nocardiopsis baichengensis]